MPLLNSCEQRLCVKANAAKNSTSMSDCVGSCKLRLKSDDVFLLLYRFIAQAGHMAEVNLGESGLDLGEMQSGQAQTVDLDLDTFISGVGYTKQCLAVICKEPGKCPASAVVAKRLMTIIDRLDRCSVRTSRFEYARSRLRAFPALDRSGQTSPVLCKVRKKGRQSWALSKANFDCHVSLQKITSAHG